MLPQCKYGVKVNKLTREFIITVECNNAINHHNIIYEEYIEETKKIIINK